MQSQLSLRDVLQSDRDPLAGETTSGACVSEKLWLGALKLMVIPVLLLTGALIVTHRILAASTGRRK